MGTPRGFAHAVDQLEGYIRGEALAFGDRAEEAMRRYLGVALDGRQIAFVEYAPNVVSPGAADTHLPTPQMSLFPISFAATTRFRATPPQEVSVESMRLLLLYLRALRRHSLTPENLSHYFGPGSDTARRIVGVFAARIHGQAAPIVAALFAEWRSAFGVVYGETLTRPDEHLRDLRRLYGIHGAADLHELLFAVHSYYALLTKTIAAELASLQSGALTASPAQEMALADSSRLLSDLSDLENGALFRKIGIRNFLEADYFGWYISTWDDELAQAVRRIPEGLAEFEPATSTLRVDETRDLLKRLYQYLMPESLRHDLGEYYTPDWLVEFLLDRAECYGDLNKTYLDPACGSGSFLRARRPPSKVPTTTRPLSAPRSMATRRSGESVKAEHLLEASVEARRRVRAGIDEGRHVCLPAGIDRGRVHHGPEAVEIVDLEAAEQVLVSLVDRIVAAARRAQRVEHLRPDRGVAPPVLGLRPGQELHRESHAFHRGSSESRSPGSVASGALTRVRRRRG